VRLDFRQFQPMAMPSTTAQRNIMDEDQIVKPVTDATARAYITRHKPDISIHMLRYFGGGSSSTFGVNDALIFRFPKFETDSDADFRQNRVLLETIRPRIMPHQVARPLERLPADEEIFPRPVYVYSFLEGEQIAKLHPTPQQEKALAALLGDFLSKLHGVGDVPGVPRMTADEMRAAWFRQYEAFRQTSYPWLSAEERGWLTRMFEDFLADAGAMQPPIVLAHGDFGDENVLVPDSFQHLNVIDFEDIVFADPVGDFCLWWGERGDDFFDHMLAAYTGEIDAHFHQRMHFYFNRIPLIYFNLSLETGNEKFSAFGHDLLRERMSRSA
jgi:aminoglycoside phosphotransferase (APT) family kinase protein